MQHSRATASPVATRPKAFRHDAVFYRGEHGFLRAVLPFVAAAVERSEPVLVAVVPSRTAALRSELGEASSRVEFVDMEAAGRNPACIIPVWHDFVARHAAGGKALNGVGEPIWAGRTPPEIAECQRHESLLNLAFANAGAFELICPYDESGLPDDVLAAARQSHPHVVKDGRRRASPVYHGLDAIRPADRRPLPPPLEVQRARAFSASDVTAVRQEVAAWAIALGVDRGPGRRPGAGRARGRRQQHPPRRGTGSAALLAGGRRRPSARSRTRAICATPSRADRYRWPRPQAVVASG